MPPTLGDRLAHILEAIDNLQSFLSGQTAATLAADLPRRLAIERSFEIICEAARHVPASVRAQETGIDWQKMTDLGNLLRHAYHRVDVGRMMTIAETDLAPLKEFVERIMQEEKHR